MACGVFSLLYFFSKVAIFPFHKGASGKLLQFMFSMMTSQTFVLLHEFGDILRGITSIRVIGADNKDRMGVFSMGRDRHNKTYKYE